MRISDFFLRIRLSVFFFLSLSVVPLAAQAPNYEIEVSADQVVELLHSPYAAVRRAVFVKMDGDAANSVDLEYLFSAIQKEQLSPQEIEELSLQITERMTADLERMRQLKAHLDTQVDEARGQPALRTSLVKLIGTPKYTGLIEDAIQLLTERKSDFLRGGRGDFAPTHNKISVLKTLLIYSLLTIRKEANLWIADDIPANLQLLYPAPLPQSVDFNTISELSLFGVSPKDEPVLFIPNAGFIFGGDFQADFCRGVDCSAYLSMATSSVRLTTMTMEYAWRLLKGENLDLIDPDRSKRTDLFDHWGLANAIEDYEAIDISEAHLQPGDLVVWRWTVESTGAREGHVVMFLEANEEFPSLFLGIEASRKDNKSYEGFLFGEFSLCGGDKETYILRRRPLEFNE